MEMDQAISLPEDGILVHGLFMDGFRWDDEDRVVEDSLPGKMMAALPMMHMEPVMDYEPDEGSYVSPLYKTSARAGTLSTTGEDNFGRISIARKRRLFDVLRFIIQCCLQVYWTKIGRPMHIFPLTIWSTVDFVIIDNSAV